MLKSRSRTVRHSAPGSEVNREEQQQQVEWEERFGGLNLKRYQQTIETDQLDLLLAVCRTGSGQSGF
jgi:hypothetical protein